MNHPMIASANAENRFNDLLNEAENHRKRRRLLGSKNSSANSVASLIQVLKGLFSNDHREAASDEMAVVKP